MDKKDRDSIKVIATLLAHIAAVIFVDAALPNRTEEELALDELRRVITLIIRLIIIIYSITYDWPVTMCVLISVFIAIYVIVLRLSIPNEED